MMGKILSNLVLLFTLSWASGFVYAETVWIDVRSTLEHTLDNIEGDVRISHDDIVDEVSKLFPEKDTSIRLYCRSGRRASVAMSYLNDAGYMNVSNAGGIDDARQERKLAE